MTPTWEQILDKMLLALGPLKIPQGGAASPSAYLRHLDRYLGEFELDEEEARRSGREYVNCPAMLVNFAGETGATGTVGRRTQRATGRFAVICAVDSRRSRDDRARLFAMLRDARRLLVGRRWADLEMEPLQYDRILFVVERPQLFAYAVRLTTQYILDWTAAPAGAGMLDELRGTVQTIDQPPRPIGDLKVLR